MKTKMLMAVMLAVTVVGMNVNAGYVVYKTKNVVNDYVKGAQDWTLGQKLTVETYTVFQTNVTGQLNDPSLIGAEKPVRIVVFKPAKGEVAYDQTTGKKVTKLLVNPLVPGNYPGTIADKYLAYSGTWLAKILNSSVAAGSKGSMAFIYDYAVEAVGEDIERLGESYAGKVDAKNVIPKSFAGTYSYVAGDAIAADKVGQDAKGSLKYDKATTTAINGNTMNAAVANVVAYLEDKKYVATWNEDAPN